MSGDQVVWLVLAVVSTGFVGTFAVALGRGWVPRSNPRINARRTIAGLLIAEVGMLVSSIPLIAGASDDTTVRYVNVGFGIAVFAGVVSIAGGFWDKFRSQSRA
ncbi:hypothetical protein [Embleya sp. NPDC059237]|uniref:hypothetical protein n=1 Tax=Embleya sp. NPDC059237 TaxID=3346784 RepID=UPI0036C93DEC